VLIKDLRLLQQPERNRLILSKVMITAIKIEKARDLTNLLGNILFIVTFSPLFSLIPLDSLLALLIIFISLLIPKNEK